MYWLAAVVFAMVGGGWVCDFWWWLVYDGIIVGRWMTMTVVAGFVVVGGGWFTFAFSNV